MPSTIDICNIALNKIGEDLVSEVSTSASTEAGKKCALLFDHARRMTLYAAQPRWAMAQADLAALSTVPNDEWSYAHQVPAGTIRVLKVANTSSRANSSEIAFEMFGDNALCSEEEDVTILYIKDVQNTGYWDPYFIEALALRLAADLAAGLADKRLMVPGLLREFREVVYQAGAMSYNQSRVDADYGNSWLESRSL